MERISRFRQFLGTPCKYTLRPKQRLLSKSYEACIRVSLPTSCHLALESVSLATSIFVFASISVMSLICLNFPDAISLLFLSQFSVFLGFFSSHSEDHHGFRKLRGPRRYCHRTIVQYFYWESHSCTPAINVYRPLFYCSHCSTVRLLDKARRCYRYYCSLVLPAHCYTNRHHREDARPIVKWRFISVQCCKSCCRCMHRGGFGCNRRVRTRQKRQQNNVSQSGDCVVELHWAGPGRHRINNLKLRVYFWYMCENPYASKYILPDHILKSLDKGHNSSIFLLGLAPVYL